MILVSPVLLLVRFIADDVANTRPDGGSEERGSGVMPDGLSGQRSEPRSEERSGLGVGLASPHRQADQQQCRRQNRRRKPLSSVFLAHGIFLS